MHIIFFFLEVYLYHTEYFQVNFSMSTYNTSKEKKEVHTNRVMITYEMWYRRCKRMITDKKIYKQPE